MNQQQRQWQSNLLVFRASLRQCLFSAASYKSLSYLTLFSVLLSGVSDTADPACLTPSGTVGYRDAGSMLFAVKENGSGGQRHIS